MNYSKRLINIMLRYFDRLILGTLATAIVSATDGISIAILSKITDIITVCQVYIKEKREIIYRFIIHENLRNLFEKTISGRQEIIYTILILAGIAIVINILKGIFLYAKQYSYSSLVMKSVTFIRNSIYERLIRLPVSFYDNHRTGDLMAKISQDVENLSNNMLQIISIIFDGIYALFFIVLLFTISWQLTLVALFFFPLAAYIAKKFSKPLRKANTKVAENISRLIIFLQESLQNIKIIKIFSREEKEIENFKSLSKENYSSTMKTSRLSSYQKPTNELLSVFGFMAVILILAFQTLYHNLSLASVVAYIACMNMAYRPLKNVSNFNDSLQKTLASAKRVFELIDLEDERINESSKPIRHKIKGAVEFKNVSFAYNPGKPVLKNISFKIKAGQTIAIVGPSGSGKTTLVSLIPLFYHNFEGKILIDGIDIRRYSLSELRSSMAMVPQDTCIFSGTIRDNIIFGKPDATDKEIEKAAEDANALSFIQRLKNGFMTEIGEKGVKLSGGEKQRIAIARAILKNPVILILDEATSSLDTESERLVQNALEKLMKNRTTFVIAHRLSTVRNADKIIVLNHGCIVESGKHEELLRKPNGMYSKLCKIQFQR